mgnify:CR=1 FL=1
MSPPPPIDPDSVPKELKDGAVASILGGLAMTARLLLSTEPVTVGWVVRRVLAAAVDEPFGPGWLHAGLGPELGAERHPVVDEPVVVLDGALA